MGKKTKNKKQQYLSSTHKDSVFFLFGHFSLGYNLYPNLFFLTGIASSWAILLCLKILKSQRIFLFFIVFLMIFLDYIKKINSL